MTEERNTITKISFPKNFLWGTSTSAYQIEGATQTDGRGRSIWDDFCEKPGMIEDATSGEPACDHYYRYKEDVGIMKSLNTKAYRFSVSWPRVIPDGKGEINEKGLDFYSNLVDELLANGIEPYVTLFHWDLPSALEEEGGWLNRKTAKHFERYVETVVDKLGDRVKNWITINEPLVVVTAGYITGDHAPGYKSLFKGLKAAHNLLRAHGYAAKKLKERDSSFNVGVSNALFPVMPLRKQDRKRAKNIDSFVNRLFMDPIFKGEYPAFFRPLMALANLGVPKEDMDLISTPIDFIGVNHYTRFVIKKNILPFIGFDIIKQSHKDVAYTDIGSEIFPSGMYETLKWLRETYDNPTIYITENGAAFKEEPENGELHDKRRVSFLKEYLVQVHKAMIEGSDIRGYFVWSLLDNFEWSYGMSQQFGLLYVYPKDRSRLMKESAKWYSMLCEKGEFEYGGEI